MNFPYQKGLFSAKASRTERIESSSLVPPPPFPDSLPSLGRNCPLSTDLSWPWDHIQHVTVTSKNLILEQCLGAALYLCRSEVLVLLARRRTGDQYARWRCWFLYSIFLNDFRSHEHILTRHQPSVCERGFWILRNNFLSSLCQQFYCY